MNGLSYFRRTGSQGLGSLNSGRGGPALSLTYLTDYGTALPLQV